MNAHIEIFLGNRWVEAASLQAHGDDRCRMEYLAPYIFGDQPAPLSLTMPVEFGREPMLADGSPDRRPPPFLYDLVLPLLMNARVRHQNGKICDFRHGP